MSQPNKKRDRHSDEMQFEFSAKLSPDDQVNLKVSGKLSEQVQRWLLPAVVSVLVTFVTAIVPHLLTLQQPTQPHLPPAVDVQSM